MRQSPTNELHGNTLHKAGTRGSADPDDDGVLINQDAWFWLRDFEVGQSDSYTVKKPANGVYFFVLEGAITVAGTQLECRDGLGVEGASSIELATIADCQLLIMDVPMPG